MIVSEWLTHVNYALRGTDDDTPAVGDEDGKYWLTVFNRKKSEMYRKKRQWESSYADKEIGAIASGDNILQLTDKSIKSLLEPARKVYVLDTNNQKHYFDVVKTDEIRDDVQSVYISGQNPQTITFTKTVLDGDAINGGVLHVPGYYEPADLILTSDKIASTYIPIDDPFWSVMAVAASVAENDITYEDKFSDLLGQANDLWKDMVRANRTRTRGNPRVSAYSVQRIRGSR